MQTRRTAIRVRYRGQDISATLMPFVQSFTFGEDADGKSDTADITFENRAELWHGELFPSIGEVLEVSIVATERGVERELPLGRLTIDEVEVSSPPSIAKLKLNSMPASAPIRRVDWSYSWENVALSKISNDVAYYVGMRLYYDTDDDPIIKRAELHDESALSFLQKICRDKGLLLKVSDNAIIVASYEKYEGAAAIMTLSKGTERIISFSAKKQLTDTYKAAEVSYSHGKQKKTITATFSDPNKAADDAGLTMKINQKVEDQAEAERLARNKLREKNMKETTVNVKMVGDLTLRATTTLSLQGFGVFEGKYLVQKVKHEISGSGFTTSLEMTKCLGY